MGSWVNDLPGSITILSAGDCMVSSSEDTDSTIASSIIGGLHSCWNNSFQNVSLSLPPPLTVTSCYPPTHKASLAGAHTYISFHSFPWLPPGVVPELSSSLHGVALENKMDMFRLIMGNY